MNVILKLLYDVTHSRDELIRFLDVAGQARPELKSKADVWIEKLRTVSDANLMALAAVLPAEAANIARGKFEPKDHPSDAV